MKKKYIKISENVFERIKNTFILIVLAFLAIIIGTTGGSILSENKFNFIKNIDVEVFKIPLNQSLPLIDTIYNSGNMDTSFLSEFKKVLGNIFEFDLNNPLTILNSQSPLFTNYYVSNYKQMVAAKENEKEHKKDNQEIIPKENIIPGTTQIPGEEKAEPQPPMKKEAASSISTEESSEERDYSKKNEITDGKIVLQNETKFKIDINKLLNEPLNFNLDRKGPKILIYHTHTSESYIEGHYSDGRYGVVKVGEELSKNLKKKYGFEVIHNATINDYDFNSSYVNALNTVSKIIKGNPSVRMVFDVHRDGLGTKGQKLRVVKKVNGKMAAQLMFVVGTNASGLSHENWRENLKLALKLQERLNAISPGLAKPIYISKNRYNQHVRSGALIIEIGGDGNSTAECLESTKYLAQAINMVTDEIK